MKAARSNETDAKQGTADAIPFDDHTFDVVLYGFCLYLCDRESLFANAAEGARVLRRHGYLVIFDFFSPEVRFNPYSHYPGLVSLKMDFRSLLTWHPDFRCESHVVMSQTFSDTVEGADDTVAISVIAHEPSRV